MKRTDSMDEAADLIFWYECQVQNGGHSQFFENRGDSLADTITALGLHGAVSQQQVLQEAGQLWSIGTKPEDDFASIDAQFGRCKPSLQEILDDFYSENGSLSPTASHLERYRQCVARCAAGSQANNAAVKEMRRLLAEPGVVEELLPLLDEPSAAHWLAFQVLEFCPVTPAVREKCLAIIRRLAAGRSVDALGAKHWLQEFERNP
jgi:hypothetical protein